ncbi:hypothetical protein [Anaerosporobacter faecicola]|uniref:hypothetical protein n=1 Tax=Anaerosporobacter faecicola TaxID=2718714 RepID=UPI001439174E|nr:hypothetical protein [Anaerosporobacter faecicola]
MKKNKSDIVIEALEMIKQDSTPTEQQKEQMLTYVLAKGKVVEPITKLEQIKRKIVETPWRFALLTSVVQTMVFTAIFGTRYTNLFLKIFGG